MARRIIVAVALCAGSVLGFCVAFAMNGWLGAFGAFVGGLLPLAGFVLKDGTE